MATEGYDDRLFHKGVIVRYMGTEHARLRGRKGRVAGWGPSQYGGKFVQVSFSSEHRGVFGLYTVPAQDVIYWRAAPRHAGRLA